MTLTTRDRLVRAAAELLLEGGRDALSTRAVSAAAGVQAPTLYRLFGDKDGLLDAVATYGFESYLAGKHALGETEDPIDDLRRGWDLHVEFGLSQPAFYLLMYGEPRVREARKEADAILRRIVGRIAEAGRLRVPVERAAQLVHATGMGVILSLIASPAERRDLGLITAAREHVIATITTDTAAADDSDVPSRAIALKAALEKDPGDALTPAERALLAEWLDRVAR
ncbi:TetR/AcrR family transcriptional regulator [Amycolatopsis regifaucium]|uniref:TetR family transcriptional regulator n=1 Tax=Amycolatopsis regifaucium TaxID=546365 RepID=A0A154MQG2_9PSEU|nr:TetR/AcrR family transcriptional regulator [Amycolatopsis regifaucium]KZB86047.1 TetR family transcriptional regulator [Amycolatopsis regifaucium]OKA04939.1 TetR family transcriptional regulator [Amycolatopsis regifaucium]SFH75917.1 regulatory protein, tetR family [Amycolatopsis regifaucium]